MRGVRITYSGDAGPVDAARLAVLAGDLADNCGLAAVGEPVLRDTGDGALVGALLFGTGGATITVRGGRAVVTLTLSGRLDRTALYNCVKNTLRMSGRILSLEDEAEV